MREPQRPSDFPSHFLVVAGGKHARAVATATTYFLPLSSHSLQQCDGLLPPPSNRSYPFISPKHRWEMHFAHTFFFHIVKSSLRWEPGGCQALIPLFRTQLFPPLWGPLAKFHPLKSA